ncbi:uncharacterized protein LOC106076574 [Biomphalaria glabrata]|uniref:Uncharacterized protein LOC106076574 n=1 Tax=Biomphalaria glabrata TaxID=6526 RepID=A0A9U8EL72_BIOGL|nr:uncharacterized protein LOC106076574 [Biomphalaria glabrata]KAI8787425.1 hypothetical protein BgiBS90_012563 [Biomphalaria glabrata]
MLVNFMEERASSNNTETLMSQDARKVHSSPFPAWAPAVTVAAAMMIFLAASFYIRHRKVVKKRELLMDYFYIIFQYGGLRRKRMVAALCNTNAITLRELGRSFMISFDSIANSDNSCPFYLEDASYPPGSNYIPGANKKTFFRSRGMISGKKARGPFRRYNTQSDESPSLNPVSLQDILMRFKTKRSTVTSPTPGRNFKNRYGKLEGSSMCAIHGDELDYNSYIEENEEPQYRRQRRNAYVAQTDSPGSRFADIVTEVGRRSLGSVVTHTSTSPYPGKRNSEPWQTLEGGCHCLEHQHEVSQHPRVFQLNSERLSPSNVVCGSHGYIPKLAAAGSLGGSCCSYRNSEPTIVIHPASIDVDPTQGWTDIRNKHTNGIVFLKKVPKGDGTTGEFYYEEQREPSVDLARRASLSKVSYVPSGNMNEYYNCLASPKKTNAEPPIGTNPVTKSPLKGANLQPTKNKRSRLSLGEIAVSNFNRRIEIVSESLHESSAHESSLESKGSQEASANPHHSKYKSTWLKFKNVFSGSRSSNSGKSSKSISLIEDRQRRRNRRQDSRWKRFFSVFTGFTSLPETKVTSHSLDCPKCSASAPSGLDCRTKFHSMDIESGLGLLDTAMSRSSTHDEKTQQCSANRTPICPQSSRLPAHTQSVPEELSKLRYQYQPKRPQDVSFLPRRYRKRFDPTEASSLSLPLSRKDFGSFAAKSGLNFSLDSPTKPETKQDFAETFPLLSANRLQQSGSTGKGSLDKVFFNRRVRNLSPLPETCCGGPKTGLSSLNTEGDNISEGSIYLTPSNFIREHNLSKENDFTLNFVENMALHNKQRYRSSDCLIKVEDPVTDIVHVRKVFSETSLAQASKKQIRTRNFVTPDIKLNENTTNSVSHDYSNCNFYSSINIASEESNSPSDEINYPQHLFSSIFHLEQKPFGQSSETVYFDSVSAVGTPSATSPLDSGKTFSDALMLSNCKPCLSHDLDNKASSLENISMGSEYNSPSLNPSQISSPYLSRSPSPCQFWQNSPKNFSQLAIPTPTRSAFVSSVTAAQSLTLSNGFNLALKTQLHGSKILLPLKSTTEKQFDSCTTKQAGDGTNCHTNVSETSPEIYVLQRCAEDGDGIILLSKETHMPKHKDLDNVISNNLYEDVFDTDLHSEHDHTHTISQVTPEGTRHPTPTRSFSTPSPTFEKPYTNPSASPDELYRANVSRLPRFARRASQGAPVPYVQNQDFITARLAGEKNGPLRESSTEGKEAPVGHVTSNIL